MTILYFQIKTLNNMREPMAFKLGIQRATNLYGAQRFSAIFHAYSGEFILQEAIVEPSVVSN